MRYHRSRDWNHQTGIQSRGVTSEVLRICDALDAACRLAARQWDDSNDYAQAKSDVVTEIMSRAEMWASQTGWSSWSAT
jgi:GrpB-like predicted nucleotidyltransferase (UPF0157 family)